ncbi:MAG: serine/threonine-protein kinase [Planctomycetaceae bacterium]
MSSSSTGNHDEQVAFDTALQRQASEWAVGRRVLPEDLTVGISDEVTRRDLLLELIHNEVILREESGELPALAEYQSRYPELAEELRIQWALDLALLGETDGIDPEGLPAHHRQIDRYELRETIGRGAMGVVYKAWDPQLKRIVALKRLRSGIDASSQEKSRLKSEAEAIARLSHENVVRVYDHGEIGDMPWLAMEYCGLGTLAEFLNGIPVNPRDAARMVRQIASGIAAAHECQIIHRDLKPSNILLVTRAGAEANLQTGMKPLLTQRSQAMRVSLCDLVPRVTDFGLARVLDEETHQTKTGMPLGTPAYMSPEQAEGRKSDIGVATDVYSLGCILYECLTGRPPFRSDTVPETLRQVSEAEPVAPAWLNPSVPADLNNIVLKCLEKSPSRRYASMTSLAGDLDNFLEGRPVQARPLPAYVRLWRWCRRSPVYATSGAIILAAVITMVIVREAYVRELTTSRNQEIESRRRAEQLQREAQDNAIAARTSETRAITSEAEAVRQLKRAEQNSVWAMEAVDTLLQKVTDQSLNSIPGMVRVRQQLLEESLRQCERFLQDRGTTDPTAMLIRGVTLQRAGRIHRQIRQYAESEARLKEAFEIFTSLVARFPEDPRYAKELGASHYQLALSLGTARGKDESFRAKEASLETWNRMLQRFPDKPELLLGKSKTLSSLGIEYRSRENLVKAEETYKEAETLLDSLMVQTPDDAEMLRTMVILAGNYAALLGRIGRIPEAEAAQGKAITAARRLATAYPGDTVVARLELGALMNMASIQARIVGREVEVVAAFEACAEKASVLADSEPLLTDVQLQAADIHLSLAVTRLTIGRNSEALVAIDRAIQIQEKLFESTKDEQTTYFLGRIYGVKAQTLKNLNQIGEAREYFRKANDLLKPLALDNGSLDIVADYITFACELISHNEAGVTEDSLNELSQLVGFARKAMEQNPEVTQLRNACLDTAFRYWGALQDVKKFPECLDMARVARNCAVAGEDIAVWDIRVAISLCLTGDYRSAMELAGPIRIYPKRSTFFQCEILCPYALAAQAVMNDNSVSEEQRRQSSLEFQRLALERFAFQIEEGAYDLPGQLQMLLESPHLQDFITLDEAKTLIARAKSRIESQGVSSGENLR